MSGERAVESLLSEALAPVDPPEGMTERLEQRLTSIHELAAEELEGWELKAMRDPRNWARPAAALVVGTAAGAALVVVRARQRQMSRRQAKGIGRARAAADRARLGAGRALGELGDDARRLVHRR